MDHVDGTVVYYDITKREGDGTTHQELTVDRLRRLIREAGCTPVERDSLYRRVRRVDNTWSVEGAPWSVDYDATKVGTIQSRGRLNLANTAEDRPVQLGLR